MKLRGTDTICVADPKFGYRLSANIFGVKDELGSDLNALKMKASEMLYRNGSKNGQYVRVESCEMVPKSLPVILVVEEGIIKEYPSLPLVDSFTSKVSLVNDAIGISDEENKKMIGVKKGVVALNYKGSYYRYSDIGDLRVIREVTKEFKTQTGLDLVCFSFYGCDMEQVILELVNGGRAIARVLSGRKLSEGVV